MSCERPGWASLALCRNSGTFRLSRGRFRTCQSCFLDALIPIRTPAVAPYDRGIPSTRQDSFGSRSSFYTVQPVKRVVRFLEGQNGSPEGAFRKLHGKAREEVPGFAPIRSGKEVDLYERLSSDTHQAVYLPLARNQTAAEDRPLT